MIFICTTNCLKSQSLFVDGNEKPSFELVAPELMKTIIYKNKNQVGKDHQISGYRVQVYSTTNRFMATSRKSLIANAYSNLPCYLIYESPEFKIRLGDFRNKMEASPFLFNIKKDYDAAFLVPSKINFPELKK